VPAFDKNGKLLPEITSTQIDPTGSGDHKIQAYNYRLCITDNPSNKLPFPCPVGYNSSRYEVLLEWLKVLKKSERNRSLIISDVLSLGHLPNGKADANNNGPFSSDYIGGSWGYPEADYRTRERICKEHREYLQGMLYFLSNDGRVPAELRLDMKKWGLAKDEFKDNDNWPYQLYIREGRRMIGEFVMTQKDLQTDIAKKDSIGMGSYNSDSHNTQRYATPDGYVLNEGDMQVPVMAYQIPYRIMLPKRREVTNLLVPVCLSASHVAYSSLRMEPQFMIIAQAAGVAAKMAFNADCTVQDVDVAVLQAKIKAQGGVLAGLNIKK
jgi:hypothetical protein